MIELDRIRLIAFDADGTLRGCSIPDQPCPNGPGEWHVLPNVRERIRTTYEFGIDHYAVISNQGGVGLGFLSHEVVHDLLREAWREAAALIGQHHVRILFCPHNPRAGCECRKPEPGMLLEVLRFYGLLPREMLYIGDRPEDEEVARRTACRFEWAAEFFGWDDPR
jgi:histidinol-phosphate phosphatase family protein